MKRLLVPLTTAVLGAAVGTAGSAVLQGTPAPRHPAKTALLTLPGFAKRTPILAGCVIVHRKGRRYPALVQINGRRWQLDACEVSHLEHSGRWTTYGAQR